MGDLNQIDSSQTVQIVAADSTGSEIGPIETGAGNANNKTIRIIPASDWTERATFNIYVSGIAIANQKSMISLLNAVGSGVLIKIRKIQIINVQTTAVTGVVAEFRSHRMTSHSGGTLITATTMDSTDTLNAAITARTGATITGESATLNSRWLFSSDEWGPGTLDTEGSDHAFHTHLSAYLNNDFCKPLTLRAGEGLTIRQNTNSTAGRFDLSITFTQE